MRITHAIDSLAFGGAERMLVDLANLSADDGHEIGVVVTRSGLDLKDQLRASISTFELARQKRLDLGAIVRLGDHLAQARTDVVHAHGLPTVAIVELATLLRGRRIPVVMHDHYPAHPNPVVPLWLRLGSRLVPDAYVSVSKAGAEWALSTGVPRSRVSVIPNGLDLARFTGITAVDVRTEFGVPSSTRVAIAIGGIRAQKGFDLLLEALRFLQSDDAILVLIVGGDRETEFADACRRRSLELGLGEIVRFVGERADVPRLIAAADLALIPSRHESGPLVLIEYLAMGLPCVSTLCGEAAEMANEAGVPGFVAPGDPIAFSNALREVLRLPREERIARGSLGRMHALRLFDLRNAMGDWYRIYDRVLHERRA